MQWPFHNSGNRLVGGDLQGQVTLGAAEAALSEFLLIDNVWVKTPCVHHCGVCFCLFVVFVPGLWALLCSRPRGVLGFQFAACSFICANLEELHFGATFVADAALATIVCLQQ